MEKAKERADTKRQNRRLIVGRQSCFFFFFFFFFFCVLDLKLYVLRLILSLIAFMTAHSQIPDPLIFKNT